MPNYEQIIVDTADGVTTITLNRPDKMNAITPTMLDELNKALDTVAADSDVGVVILTGAGRAFSAGVDLVALGELKLEAGSIGSGMDAKARNAIKTIESMSKPVIAKVNGFCFTGALEIALSCDLLYAAQEAKFGDTHAKWGLRPTWGMSQRLPRAVGFRKARELSFTARTFTGTEAADMGMANEAVPAAELDLVVAKVAATIVPNSREAIAAYKDLYRAAANNSLIDGINYEQSTKYEINDTNNRLAEFTKK
jgi:enoyl-CoA hydratase/carnithine racemase